MPPPRLGIAIPTATVRNDAGAILAQLDRWSLDAGGYPVYMPIWSRLHVAFAAAPDGAWFPDAELLDGLAARDVAPMIYMTSGSRPYAEILGGAYDGHFELWGQAAARLGSELIVRWDQEPNGNWPARWASESARDYRRTFAHVERHIRGLGGAANVRMFYCPILKRREDLPELERYFPGDAAQVVGFDSYARAPDPAPIDVRWARARDALREFSDVPIVVGEFGIRRGLPDRADWLAGLERLDGIAAAVYFDIDLPRMEQAWSLDAEERARLLQSAASGDDRLG